MITVTWTRHPHMFYRLHGTARIDFDRLFCYAVGNKEFTVGVTVAIVRPLAWSPVYFHLVDEGQPSGICTNDCSAVCEAYGFVIYAERRLVSNGMVVFKEVVKLYNPCR